VGIGAGLYMYVIVVQKFTFAISSPDEFLFLSIVWGGVVVQWVECWTLRSVGRGFKSSRQRCVTTICLYLCASVIKQYNLVLAKGRWCSAAGEVTAGLAESNGSLPPSGWLRSPAGWLPVHRDQLRAQRSISSMGKPLPLPLPFSVWYDFQRISAKVWLQNSLKIMCNCACLFWLILQGRE